MLAFSLAGGLHAAEQRWLKLTSSHFEIFTDESEKKAREAILYFEQVRSFFVQILGLKAADRVRVVGFRSEAEYKRYRTSRDAPAYTTADHTGDVIVMDSLSSALYPVAVHEFTHTLLRPFGDRVPLWLNEGLAELFSTLQATGNRINVGTPQEGRLRSLQSVRWIPLRTLLAVGPETREYKEGDPAQAFYAESWALVHMLDLDPRYRGKFGGFQRLVFTGTPVEAALLSTWGKDLDGIETDLRLYTRQRAFVYTAYHVTLEKSAETAEVTAAPPAEIGTALANLLAAIQPDEAAAEYARLEREYPDNPEPAEGAGYLALRQGRQDDAREHLGRASTLGSRRARVHADYGALLSGEDPAGSADALARAVRLEPANNYYRGSYCMALVSAERYEEAAKQFEQIKEPDPKNAFRTLFAGAFANYRIGKPEKARALLGRARPLAKDEEIKMVERLQTALDWENRPPRAQPAPDPVAAAPPPETAAGAGRAQPAMDPVKLVAIEGVLERLDCLGAEARVRLRVAGRLISLIIDDPRVGQTQLSCGAQRPRPVQVEYEPRAAGGDPAGTVRTIRYKPR